MTKKIICAVIALTLLCGAVPASGADSGSIPLPILMYHHISEDPARLGSYVISPATFEGDLKYLKDHGYTSVSARELLAWSQGNGQLPEKPVMITFDDGQLSFGVYAVPLLEKYGMCAIMSIVGKYADIYTENHDENVNYAYFSWPALAQLVHSPAVELGAHTYDMHGLDTRRGCLINRGESESDYSAALNRDLSEIEARFGEYLDFVPSVFAYPYGLYCSEASKVLRERGYNILFTCEENVNHLCGTPDELMKLGRYCRTSSADRAAFFARMGIK
ncbi:MAG: polysaccharide deacetylase family protein [Oscillospiraceae bacterium]